MIQKVYFCSRFVDCYHNEDLGFSMVSILWRNSEMKAVWLTFLALGYHDTVVFLSLSQNRTFGL